VIQYSFTPEIQERLDQLRDTAEWGELTPEESQELLIYEDLLEQQNVKRLEALIQLAALRKTALPYLW
jgi:hypothetical protein